MEELKIMSDSELSTKEIPQKLQNALGVSLSSKSIKKLKTVKRFIVYRNDLLQHVELIGDETLCANTLRMATLWEECITNTLCSLGGNHYAN